MRQVKIIAVIVLLTLVGCEKDPKWIDHGPNTPPDRAEVIKQNLSLIINFCGIHCHPCGTWGWNEFEKFRDELSDEALALMVYGSNGFNRGSILICQESTDIERNLHINSWPTFAINHKPILGVKSISALGTKVNEDVTAHSAAPVEAGASVIFKKNKSNSIDIDYRMRVFDANEGANYRLAIYVVEDSIKEYQAGHPDGENALHPLVLRSGYQGAWGIPFVPGQDASLMSGSGIIDCDASWNSENYKVYAVIYDRQGETYRFVNASRGIAVN